MESNRAQYWANVAIIIGVPIAVCSLIASGYGLFLNRDAINENKEAIIAQTVYQMQVDGRRQLDKLQANPEIFKVMIERTPYDDIDSKTLEDAAPLILSFFQYYSSVNFQREAGNFPDALWLSFSEEFCAFVQIPIVSGIWISSFSTGSFNESFKESVEKCLE